MRQKRVTGDKQMQRTSKKEPLTEGIQRKKRKQRNWASMTNKELVSYAKTYIEENGIKSRKDLEKADAGLYTTLWRRNLLDAVVPVKRKQRNWSSMNDTELISYAKKFIEENQIKNRKGLEKADVGLYQILIRRNLLDVVIPEKQHRDWSSMSNKEFILFAKKFIEENGIKSRKDLYKADGGLCYVLRKRNLLDAVIPNKQNSKPRGFFTKMSDEELVSYTKEIIEENGIKNRSSLQKGDNSLYEILRKRNLLDAVIPEKREHRKWFSMNNNELVQFAKKFIEENKIKNRKGLTKADPGLHDVLKRRNLLSAVFSPIEEAKKTAAVKQVVDAMKEF